MEKNVLEAPHNDLSDANFPMDAEGRVYHLAVKKGEVANRVVSVGETRRARLLASLLDAEPKVYSISASRGFEIHTGKYKGVPVSVIATGMGIAMVDFVVRETRAVVDGPMAFVRFGTCGTPQKDVSVGTVAVSNSSVGVLRNYDAFDESFKGESGTAKGKALGYYMLTRPLPADPELTHLISEGLEGNNLKHVAGMNVTADSFYGSQGRLSSHFDDNNATLIDELLEVHPQIVSFEMETYHFLHLAQCSKGTMRATAACIVLAQRKSNEFLDHKRKAEMELAGGAVVLQALADCKLDESKTMNGPECVWNHHA